MKVIVHERTLYCNLNRPTRCTVYVLLLYKFVKLSLAFDLLLKQHSLTRLPAARLLAYQTSQGILSLRPPVHTVDYQLSAMIRTNDIPKNNRNNWISSNPSIQSWLLYGSWQSTVLVRTVRALAFLPQFSTVVQSSQSTVARRGVGEKQVNNSTIIEVPVELDILKSKQNLDSWLACIPVSTGIYYYYQLSKSSTNKPAEGMPCLILTGHPSVGKTTVAEKIKERVLLNFFGHRCLSH